MLKPKLPTILLLLILSSLTTTSFAAATTQPAPETIYEDPSAQSTASITQILPNSTTSQLTLISVRLIQIQSDTIVINWSTSAVTLLPRQFVLNLTINKHLPPASPLTPSIPPSPVPTQK